MWFYDCITDETIDESIYVVLIAFVQKLHVRVNSEWLIELL